MRTHYQYKKRILVLFFLVAMLLCSLIVPAQTDTIKFDEQYYKANFKFLADDLLEGRRPGTRGGNLAALYIARQFESIGLKPISDEQEYFQMVPAVGFSTDYKSVQFTIHANGKKETLDPYNEVILLSQEPTESIKIKGDLVFAGYGIEAPEYDWNDFKDQNVSGKILVFLCNDPDYKKTGFGSESWTYYGMFTYKEEMAILKGAKGIIYLHNNEMAALPFSAFQHAMAPEWSYSEYRTKNPLALYAWVAQPAFERVLSMVGLNFNVLKEQADRKDFHPMPLKLNVDVSFKQNHRHYKSPNVIGILPGKEKGDECILCMAHYDHLGIGEPIQGDSIYNGARDNASGTAGLISLAREFCAHPVKRSVVFLATTGEENMFLGSEYYSMNPVVPLKKTIIVFNMDIMSFYGRQEMFSLYPIECSDAVPRVKSLGQELGLKLKPDGIDTTARYFRYDHLPFNSRDVVALTVGLGGKYLATSENQVAEIRKKIRSSYHQPNDEVYSCFRYDGVMQELEVLYHVGRYYAEHDERPNLKPDNPSNPAKRMIRLKKEKEIL